MTIGVLAVFLTCIIAGIGLTFHSGIAMRAEERFFSGWILGIVAFTITGMVTTRLFTFGGPAVAIAAIMLLVVSLTG